MVTSAQALLNKQKCQKEGRESWFANSCIGTACHATGVGKTKLAIDCIQELRGSIPNLRVLIVTPTEDLRDHGWPEEFEKWECSMTDVKIVCYASLAKAKLDDYDFIVYDECHRITPINLEKLSVSGNKLRLGLTATYPKIKHESDVDRVDFLRKLLPPIHTITVDEAVDLGLIADFDIKVLKFHLDGVTKNIAVGKEMRTERLHYNKLTKKLQWAMIKNIEAMKFKAISDRVQFLYNLPSKLRLAQQCLMEMMKDNDKRTLVFAGSIEQITNLCGDNVFHSQSNAFAFGAFQRKESRLLGSVLALNEGVNLIEPDQALMSQISSIDRSLIQRIGRLIRIRYDNPGFKARIVILVASGTADEKWYKSAIENFETKRIKEYIVRVPDIIKDV